MKKRILGILLVLTIISMQAVLPFLAGGAFAETVETSLGVVTTKYGDVQGVAGEDYSNVTLFKGIPYAKPPVGELRWTAPQDPESWEGVKVCDTYGDAATQQSYVSWLMDADSTWGEFYPNGAPSNSEDCLYLNVATPAASSDEKRPVLVWIHGGAFAHGYAYEEEFNPEELANRGVIVVTIGHRLNVFGTLALPQLSAETEYGGSGNYMVMDCAKGVEWVYENIEAFGGDASRIVLCGQSGGSIKTSATFISPLTQGMIAGTYNMSNGLVCNEGFYSTLEEVEQRGLELIGRLGYDENTPLDVLRAIPAEDFVEAMGDSPWGTNNICVDGYALVEMPTDYYLRAGQLDNKTLMFGQVFGESGSYGATSVEELLAKLTEEYGEELMEKYDIANTMPFTEDNVALYNYTLKARASVNGNRLLSAVLSRQNKNMTMYGFLFGRTTPGSETGWHSMELWYMFNSLRDVEWQTKNRAWQVWDYITGDIASSYWANYVKNGDPNGVGLANWPECNAENNFAIQFIDFMPQTWDDMTTFDLMDMEKTAISLGIDFDALGLH